MNLILVDLRGLKSGLEIGNFNVKAQSKFFAGSDFVGFFR